MKRYMRDDMQAGDSVLFFEYGIVVRLGRRM